MSSLSSLVNVSSSIQNILTNGAFTNQNPHEITLGQSLFFYLILILVIYITMWFGSFIFNTSFIKIFPSVKKVSIIDFLGLYILSHILFC
jgi:hypothetical protein